MIYKWLTIQMKCHREPDFLHGFLTIILDDRTNHTVINHIKESTLLFLYHEVKYSSKHSH